MSRDRLLAEVYRPMAFFVLLLHWVLLFGWGLMLNDSGGGYLYCRLTMASTRDVELAPWAFFVGGVVVLILLGRLDRRKLRLDKRLAYYPLPLFIMTQLFTMWLLEHGTRY